MSGKNINFDGKKIKNVNFTKTEKHFRQLTLIKYQLIKYQFLKKSHMVQRMH